MVYNVYIGRLRSKMNWVVYIFYQLMMSDPAASSGGGCVWCRDIVVMAGLELSKNKPPIPKESPWETPMTQSGVKSCESSALGPFGHHLRRGEGSPDYAATGRACICRGSARINADILLKRRE